MYPPDDPTRPCRPKAGQGLVIIMMLEAPDNVDCDGNDDEDDEF